MFFLRIFASFKVRFLGYFLFSSFLFPSAIFDLDKFFVFFVSIRTYLDTTKIKLTEYQIPVKNLPVEFEKLDLIFTADVQVDKYTPAHKMKNFIDEIKNDIDYSFIVLDLRKYPHDKEMFLAYHSQGA